MSQLETIKNIISKYNVDDNDKIFLTELHNDLYNYHINECIIDDTIEQYEKISNNIIEYVNNNHLNDMKNTLKQYYNPLTVEGWICIPNNLYTDDELETFKNVRETEYRNSMETIVGDVPNEPNL